MVTQQQVLDTLKSIGLNLYERKLWVALLSRGTSTAGELSKLAKVPHSRTYDILQSLTDKGFVLTQNTKPLKYVAIKPTEAFERVKKRLRNNLDVMVQRLDYLQKTPIAKELDRIYKEGFSLVEPGDLTASLKGRHSMHNQLETLFKGAKSNISIITTGKGILDMHANHGHLLKKAAKRGVKIRIAAPHSKDSKKILYKLGKIANIKNIGKQKVNGRFIMVDGSHTVMALTDEKVHPTQDVSLWTQSSHLAKNILNPMFESIWEKI